ncbi:hypothetical protein [Motilimonas eburnea]|uniref:hypothetical protein n=1 Tax=Motilimonas eburnea TaxID=1737488 RepID=UPI001E362114|nr:hypothetical protein [Motilimonas eburnea]MCE2573904.1 hypothetical protein [Motilimonas eburnea]
MNPAILKLTSYIQELEEKTEFDTLEEKAEHIGLIIQIKDAIGQLELCEKHGITGGSLVNELPETCTIHHQFVVAHQNESTNPENWEEVLFNGRQIWFSSGDLVVRK